MLRQALYLYTSQVSIRRFRLNAQTAGRISWFVSFLPDLPVVILGMSIDLLQHCRFEFRQVIGIHSLGEVQGVWVRLARGKGYGIFS